jgi:hypothetical protein
VCDIDLNALADLLYVIFNDSSSSSLKHLSITHNQVDADVLSKCLTKLNSNSNSDSSSGCSLLSLDFSFNNLDSKGFRCLAGTIIIIIIITIIIIIIIIIIIDY